jgi:hypothetical protein
LLNLYLKLRSFVIDINGIKAEETNPLELMISSKAKAVLPGKVLTQAMKKLTGKSISSGIFRKVFETAAHEANLSDSDRKLYSENCLHSLQVADDYYTSKDIEKNV